MEPIKVYEGTWEEIFQHADEFAGCRVHLTVLPDEQGQADSTNIEKPTGEEIVDTFATGPDGSSGSRCL